MEVMIKKTMDSILKEDGLDPETCYEIEEEELVQWTSSVHKVIVKVKCNKKLDLFFKFLSDNTDISDSLDTEIFFRNEVTFYNEVMNRFIKFQQERNVSNMFTSVPKCYSAVSDGEHDVIVLEDLKAKGFVMLDKMKVMNPRELKLLMQELGKFHAISLAMKDQQPTTFERIKHSLEETVFCKRFLDKFGELYEFAISDALKMAKLNFSEDEKYLHKLNIASKDICEKMIEIVRAKEEDEPYNVITHGDLWFSNLMFHYEEESNYPDQIKMLDFQVSRYASPALDVSYILISSTDKQTRENHQTSLLQSYHRSLSDYLIELGSNPEKIFPYVVLEDQLKKYARFGLWLTLFNLPHTLDEGDSFQGQKQDNDIQEEAEGQTHTAINAVYSRKSQECQDRILDCIKYVVDSGYLD
ncbi:hypothetical protein L9F63_019725 [Diploptera punctata]|uniref:CHK kinase-like domain-containing protein n=1 Tax=Diploptera punctata TaxID=6984 RepID=A0AAD7ZU01_DIPPU|nr:hypothetical protein L9F63_019725 [Diploptera punctata]